MHKKMVFLVVMLVAIVALILTPMAVHFYERAHAAGPELIVDNQAISLIQAKTDAERAQGLSGRSGLASNEAMFFIFDQQDYWGFWMKNMKFSIDMIWLDKDYKIVSIQPNATPETYPVVFQPTAPAMYVLETQAGFADAHHLTLGQMLTIK